MWANLLLQSVAALCLSVNAYPTFREKIPNGDRVPNPCNLSTTWPGVGHQNVYGAGDRNPFGLDFAANDHVWNRTVCEKDSDGDGLTNGEELGDPNCNWTEGSHYHQLDNKLSHPGVCEPIDSPVCSVKNSWLKNCGTKKLNCLAINETGVENYELRFPVTAIPSDESVHLCHLFALPNDSVADIIAFEPIIDNAIMLHHMLFYACNDGPRDHPVGESYRCRTSMEIFAYCSSLIGIWTVGVEGQCLYSQMGFRTGPGGIQYALLQLHWNNPELMTNQADSSGMRIYHTTQLRPNRGQIVEIGQKYAIGQKYVEIPPGQEEVTITGTCSGRCTTKMSHSIFVTAVGLHMHSLGKSIAVSLRRNGKTVQVMENETSYDYHNPRMHALEPPIEVKPGDEIELKCVYDSTQRNATTYIGDTASDEMCLGFLVYFPLIEGFGICGQRKDADICPFD